MFRGMTFCCSVLAPCLGFLIEMWQLDLRYIAHSFIFSLSPRRNLSASFLMVERLCWILSQLSPQNISLLFKLLFETWIACVYGGFNLSFTGFTQCILLLILHLAPSWRRFHSNSIWVILKMSVEMQCAYVLCVLSQISSFPLVKYSNTILTKLSPVVLCNQKRFSGSVFCQRLETQKTSHHLAPLIHSLQATLWNSI